MKRDFDLIREILLVVESKDRKTVLREISLDNYTKDEIEYHVELLIDNGFINGKITHTTSGMLTAIVDLEYAGHDLLDSIREKSFFDKVKQFTKDKGVPLTIDSIKMAVPIVTKSLFGV